MSLMSHRPHSRAFPFVAMAILTTTVGLFLATGGQPVEAATLTVTKGADTNDGVCDADCSLREAIGAANAAFGADTVELPAGTYTLNLAGAGEDATGDLDITGDLTINGAGAAATSGARVAGKNPAL